MNKIKAWIIAMRPFVLPAYFLLPLAGYALQYGTITIDSVLIAIGTVIMAIGVHFYNNYDDFVRGIDKLEEGSKVKSYTQAPQILPAGIIKPSHMLAASVIAIIISILVGGGIMLKYRYPLVFGVCGFIFAISYNVFSFKFHGLGGVSLGGAMSSAFLVGAMMHTFAIKPAVIILALFLGYVGFISLNIDAYYDMETDKNNGITTFPMLHPNAFIFTTKASIPISIIVSVLLILVSSNRIIFGILAIPIILSSILLYKSLSNSKFIIPLAIDFALALIGIIILCSVFPS